MRNIFVSLFLFVIYSVSAQNSVSNTTPVIQSGSNEQKSAGNKIQWNYMLLTKGVIALTYERRISDYAGIEGGAGITYFDPYSVISDWGDFGYHDNYTISQNKDYNIGTFFSGAMKIYPKKIKGNFEGVYVSPIIRYRSYSCSDEVSTSYTYYDASYNSYSGEADDTYTLNIRAIDIAMLLGYQYETDSGLLWNLYIGTGWTKKRYEDVDFNATTLKNEMTSYSRSYPNIFAGMSMGFAF